jgi:hypothetical protein
VQVPYPIQFRIVLCSSKIGNWSAAERLSGGDVIPLRKRAGGLVARVLSP